MALLPQMDQENSIETDLVQDRAQKNNIETGLDLVQVVVCKEAVVAVEESNYILR